MEWKNKVNFSMHIQSYGLFKTLDLPFLSSDAYLCILLNLMNVVGGCGLMFFPLTVNLVLSVPVKWEGRQVKS